MYDIFFIIRDKKDIKEKIRNRFPLAKFCILKEDTDLYELLLSAQKRSLTKIFWVVNVGYQIKDDFYFDYKASQWDEIYVHTFIEEQSNTYDGVYLIPKTYRLTKNESKHMFFMSKKEIPIIASVYKYDIFYVKTYADYVQARDESNTDVFYVVTDNIIVSDDFKFDYQIPKGDQDKVHVFKNGEYYDGIFIAPKKIKISEREFNNRFIINRIEVDIKASEPNSFDIVYCNSYDDYLEKKKTVKTDMLYVVTDGIEVSDDFKFDYQVPKWNQDKVHVFKNGEYYDGICLFPRNKTISQREFDYKFFLTKIEVDIISSNPIPFDIVFISYNEPNADENYQKLIDRFPRAKRIHGIKGIHQAHKEAAKISNTSMFWAVDGDADIIEDFDFNYQVPVWETDMVHVWRSKNPINDLEYGYGGVKLLPTKLTRNIDTSTVDMTTSISSKFKAVETVSNISKFNTDEFNTWKSAFRECVKLSSKVITGQIDDETHQRLDIWCNVGEDKPFGKFAILGARAGKEFGSKYKDNIDMLSKINDWKWLDLEFQKTTSL